MDFHDLCLGKRDVCFISLPAQVDISNLNLVLDDHQFMSPKRSMRQNILSRFTPVSVLLQLSCPSPLCLLGLSLQLPPYPSGVLHCLAALAVFSRCCAPLSRYL